MYHVIPAYFEDLPLGIKNVLTILSLSFHIFFSSIIDAAGI